MKREPIYPRYADPNWKGPSTFDLLMVAGYTVVRVIITLVRGALE